MGGTDLAAPKPAIFVLWQSLVVSAYRSFFVRLAALGYPVALAAPDQFHELAQQLVRCEPFQAPFDTSDGDTPGLVLRAWTRHVQIVYFRGLRRVLGRFFAGRRGSRIFVCIAEPYAPTTLFAYVAGRLALGRRMVFVCYGLQNIVKSLPLPLRVIQGFLFKRSAAILVAGREQEEVVRAHGYTGKTLPFPLWFDSDRFKPEPHGAATKLCLGYAGALSEAKGVPDLLAVLRANAARWSSTCSVRLAGSGPLSALVEVACGELRAAGYEVVFERSLGADQMPAFYRALDLLVVPSRTMPNWKEQFGRVIVEAQACGVVVIGSDSGEIPTVIGDPERVFPEGDLAAIEQVTEVWLKCLAEAAESLATRQAWRKAEAAKVRQRYSDTVLAEAFAARLQALSGELKSQVQADQPDREGRS